MKDGAFMRKIKVKRLVYHHLGTNEIIYGGEEYDGHLTDANILGSIFTAGKHQWTPNFDHIAMYQFNDKGDLVYRISVETFDQYQKTGLDILVDTIKRILRI